MTPEKRLRTMPISCQGIYKAAMAGHSRAKGVKAFCQECVGYERKLVRNCTDTGCPLYPYRPYQLKDFEEEEEEVEKEEEKREDCDTEEDDVEKKEVFIIIEEVPPIKKKSKKKVTKVASSTNTTSKSKKRRTFGRSYKVKKKISSK